MGHARALVNVTDPTLMLQLYETIVKESLSVRKVEEWVKSLDATNTAPTVASPTPKRLPQEYKALSERLSAFFQIPVKIERNPKGKGKIVLPFVSDEELEDLMDVFDKMM